MSAPKGRAVAPARPLLYLSGVDGLVFLMVTVAALVPLLPLDGPFPMTLLWTSVVLAAASASGFAGGLLLGRNPPSRSYALFAGIANAVLILVVAAYLSTAMQLLGWLGPVLAVLAVPGLVSSWMVRTAPGQDET